MTCPCGNYALLMNTFVFSIKILLLTNVLLRLLPYINISFSFKLFFTAFNQMILFFTSFASLFNFRTCFCFARVHYKFLKHMHLYLMQIEVRPVCLCFKLSCAMSITALTCTMLLFSLPKIPVIFSLQCN